MIFQCGDLERALRTPELMPDARAHAENCPACRYQIYLWTEISRLAPQLHEEWESEQLWPGIRATLTEQQSKKRKPQSWRWVLALAACVALAFVLLSPPQRPPARRELLTDAALDQVQQAETAYARSIANLAAAAGPNSKALPRRSPLRTAKSSPCSIPPSTG